MVTGRNHVQSKLAFTSGSLALGEYKKRYPFRA
jgi:hypothetical protein